MEETSNNAMKTGRMVGLLVVVAATLAYANSFRGTWVFDDVHTMRKAISHGTGIAPISERPVTDLTFLLNWKISGFRAADFHAVNLAIHILSALLLFGLTGRLLCLGSATVGTNRYRTTVVAGITAAVWAVHPLATSAVMYISQRYEILMALFYLLTLYAVVRGATAAGRNAGRAWYLVAVVSAMLGMGSKEVMITAPVAVVLCDWVFLSRGSMRKAFRERAWLYIGLVLGLFMLFALMQVKEAEPRSHYMYQGVSPLQYLATEWGVTCRYLKLAFWPTDLCFDYGWRPATSLLHAAWPGLLWAVIVVTTGMGLLHRRKLAFPVAMFLLILAPTSTFIPRPDPIMEYRMYLPLAGLVAWAVCGVSCALGACPAGEGKGRRLLPRVMISVALLLILLLGALTLERNEEYSSDVKLWASNVRRRPGNVRALLGLGSALFREQETQKSKACFLGVLRQIDEYESAGQHAFSGTVRAQAHNNLGAVYFREGEFERAALEFEAALSVFPSYAEAEKNLARARNAQSPKKEQPRP